MNIKLQRAGEFETCEMGADPRVKCDLASVHRHRYEVLIEATDLSLSPEGFVIENSRIQEYFERTYNCGGPWDGLSCELIAAKAAKDIATLLVNEKISVRCVTATVFGSHDSRLTAVLDV